MRWRQVLVLYVVLAALAAEWLLVERRRPTDEKPAHPTRQRFLPVGRGDVREVRLIRGGRVILSRREEGRWTVLEPADARIPADLMSAFTDALTEAEEIDVMPEGSTDTYGFDATATRIELSVEHGTPVVVTVGTTNPTGTAVYARRGDTPTVFLIGRNVRYYEDLLFQALPTAQIPPDTPTAPVGG